MARTIYGAELFQSPKNEVNANYVALGKNSEVFANYDIVSISGATGAETLGVAAATSVVVGVIVKGATMTSTNQTVAKVVPGYITAEEGNLFLMGTNSDLTDTLTDYGKYYKLSGATGAQVVDVSSGVQTTTNRVVQVIKVDPFNEGGTGSGSGLRQVIIRFVKTPVLNPR